MRADIESRKLHTGLLEVSQWLLTLLYSSSSSSIVVLYYEALGVSRTKTHKPWTLGLV